MFQTFYKDTLGSRFIKSLLAQTPIPVFECAVEGNELTEGCYYVFKRYIIYCVTSGKLIISQDEKLVPSDILYPSKYLFVGEGFIPARFYVKDYSDVYNPKFFSTFHSTTNYYDSETHKYLGKYLRYIYSIEGLNLLPFYNCYNGTYLKDTELSAEKNLVKVKRVQSVDYKVVSVPIVCGKSYSIYIDCPDKVLMRAHVRPKTGFVEEVDLNISTNMLENLYTSGKIFSNMRFDKPVKFKLTSVDSSIMNIQKNLYLLIQLPKDNDSSIVVFEDFESSINNVFYDINGNKDFDFRGYSSLTRINSKTSFAFSDRLIEYLLNNVIYRHDFISKNIENVQEILCKYSSEYKQSFIRGTSKKGVWDDNIPEVIADIMSSENISSDYLYDHDGNINKDVEVILRGGKL